MKKITTILTTILISFLILQGDVFAEDNINIGTDTEDIGGCTLGKGADSCLSGSYDGVRITIVDKNGIRIPGTNSVDYMTDESSKTKIAKGVYYNSSLNDRKEVIAKNISAVFSQTTSQITFDRLTGLENFIGDEGTSLPKNYFETYFTNMDDAEFADKILARTGYLALLNSSTDMCEWTDEVYFVVEPLAYINTLNGAYFGTGTELAKKAYNSEDFDTMLYGNSKIIKRILSYAIFVRNDKAVFAGYQGVPLEIHTVEKSEHLDPIKGYSVGIYRAKDYYDIPCNSKLCPADSDYPGQPYDNIEECYKYTCYDQILTCGDDSCSKTNYITSRACSSTMKAFKADNLSDCDLSNRASGKKTYTLKEGVCSLYCTESGTASYPGNVSPAITVGTNLAWPTNSTGLYPLTTKSTLTCKVEMENGSAVTNECLQLAKTANYTYSGNEAVAKLIYNDTKEDVTVNLESTCSTVSSVLNDTVIIENSCSYTLPVGKNVAIDKETVAFVNMASNELSSAVTNYILITKYNGVLPIGGINWSDDTVLADVLFGKDYKLEITDLPLGYNGKFTSDLNSTEYVCHYQVTTDTGGSCSCPPGTKYSGIDLYGNMKGTSTTCAEAIELYCNSDTLSCTKSDGTKVDITNCLQSGKDLKTCETEAGCYNNKVCPSDTNYAGYAYEEDARYKACIYGGGTEADCIDMICNCGSECKYTCPTDSYYPNKDISACVFEQRGQGKTLVEAQSYCEKSQCYSDGNIIYRTISLENPFPSMDGDKQVTQSGLKAGMFNDTIKGRYPGTNWNSVTLVYNKILNNRGYDGSAIYQEATPLYTINLDAVAIKQIRDYNKTQIENGKGGYADFELTCTDGAYCISSFLHDGKFTTAKGESILDSSNSTCASAKDKASFISCYTTG